MTDNARFDVTGMGNAIVDVLAHVDDAFIVAHGLNKGAMTLIDADQAESLYAKMPPAIEASGGSAGNTMAGIASLGGTGAYIGKVRNDQLGAVFTHDMRAIGVTFDTPQATSGAPTARCLILVTPDAQRTMNTYLGACVELGPEDIDAERIAASRVVYMEGYLYDKPRAKAAFREAARIAHEAGRKVSLTLSDGFCVDRHRAEFKDLVENHVDILFANSTEIDRLYETQTLDDAVDAVRGKCEVACITRSELGSLVVTADEIIEIPAEPTKRLVDTTGAGDLYAAGVIYGYTRGLDLRMSGRIGSICAAEVISHMGPRPETSLKDLVAERVGRV